MPSTPDLCPCSPTPSTISSNSTPTEALAAKLDLLDRQWSAHKAQSPIKMLNPRKRHHSERRPEQSSGISVRGNNNNNNNNDNSNHSVGAVEDDDSVGQDSVSTLGSTESVFDRLYRQRKITPKSRQGSNRNQDNRVPDISGSVGASGGGNFGSPVGKRRQSTGTKNRKNRLGAYSNSSISGDVKSVGYADTTPQRRTARNSNIHRRNDGSASVASTLSGGSGFDGDDTNSVFARLYRNEKRTEKLWKKPREFVPTLSPFRKQQSKSKTVKKSGDKAGQNILFSNRKKGLQEIHDKEQQHRHARTHKNANTPHEENRSGIKILSIPEDDLDAINELGKHMENVYDGCSPTVALTSVSSMNWDESPDSRRHSNDVQLKSPVEITMTYLNEESGASETVGKQLKEIEADQQSFLGSKSDTSGMDQNQNSTIQNDAGQIKKEKKPVVEDHPINIPNKGEYSVNNDQARIPASSYDSDTSTTKSTDNCGFFSLNQSCRSLSTDNNFFVERIDRLSSPIRRRNRENHDNKMSYELERVFTPRRLRSGSAITIQRSFRLHQAELQLASAMIQSWRINVQPRENNKIPTLSPIHRERALQQAVRAVKCWWILEGLHIEDNWITLAWENEVCIGDDIRVQVNLICEAKSLQITSRHWEPMKVAVLLAKAGLFKAIQREQANHSMNELCENATKLQHWFKKRRHTRCARQQHERRIDVNVSSCPVNDDGENDKTTTSSPINDITHDSRISSSQNLREEAVNDIQFPSTNPPLDDRRLREEHTAAIKIQSFLRLTVLKSAIKESPSAINRLRAALETADPMANRHMQTASHDAARNILCSSMIEQQMGDNRFPTSGEAHTKMTSEKELILQEAAALANHNIVRTYVTGLKKYREKKKATLLQATFRGYRTRKRLEIEDLSALVIQFAWSDRRYIKIKAKNATKIQTHLRMFLCQRDYEMHRFCIIFVQAGWRRAIARRRLVSLRSSILMVQSVWRGSKDRTLYLKFLSAIRSIQYLCKVQHMITIYKNECHAATIMQSWWRMQCSRIFLLRSLKAVTSIQTHVRSFIQCRKFRKTQFDCIMIQRTWRAYRWTKRYESQKRAAVCLQTFCRARLSINAATRRHRSILDIQRVYRGLLCRHILTEGLKSATKLQNNWRRYHEQVSYRNSIKAVIILQAFARVVIQRKKYRLHRNAIVDIQRVTRGCLCRQKMPVLKEEAHKARVIKKSKAAVVLQKIWRASVERKRYTVLKQSIILLQKVTRRVRVKSLYKRTLTSGRTIQIWLKRVVVKSRAQKAKLASIEIQRIWRATIASKYVASLRMEKSTTSSIIIQSMWRGARARTAFNEIRIATIAIQGFYRTRSAMKVLKGLIQDRAMKESSILIQCQWRGAMARENYILARISAIMIQASVRRILTKKLMNQRVVRASILIQSHWRRAKAYEGYEKARVSAITIQSSVRRRLGSKFIQELRNIRLSKSSVTIQTNWRGAMARDAFTTARGSAIIIQACARRMMATRIKEALKYEGLANKPSILIQSQWRGAISRFHFRESRSSAIIIQACVRRMMATRIIKVLELEDLANKSSILIQSQWRGAISRFHFRESRSSAIIIQAAFRRMSSSKQIQSLKTSIRCSILIQSYWRGAIERYRFNEIRVAATMIQSSVRGMLVRTRSDQTTHSLILVQRAYRAHVAKNKFHRSRTAAICIQHIFRSYRMKSQRFATTSSVVLIQALWRRAAARLIFNSYQTSTTFIQRTIRGYLVRNRFHRNHVLATKIQRTIRGYLVQKRLHRNHALKLQRFVTTSSVVLIQALWRRVAARSIFNFYQTSTIFIQRTIRGYLVRKRLQRNHALATKTQRTIRGHLVRKRIQRNQASATKIQRTLRGYLVLKRLHRNHSLATKIQRRWKIMHMVRYEKQTELSTLIQSYWRSSVARGEYMQYRAATMIIQAMIRGAQARSQFKDCQASVVRIQSIFRGHLDRKYLNEAQLRLYKATEISTFIQSHWRASLARGKYMQHRAAAMMIQSMIRGAHVRSQWRFVRLLSRKKRILNSSARTIQIAYIAWRMDIALWEMKSLVVLLQRGIRGHLSRSVVQYALMHMNSSRNSTIVNTPRRLLVNQDPNQGVSTIASWNTAVSGARISAAIVIQSFARRYLVRNFGLAFDKRLAVVKTTRTSYSAAAIVIQRSFLAWSQFRNFSAIKIQKTFRRWIAWKDFRAKITLLRLEIKAKAATKVQNLQRCRKQKRQFLLQKQAIVKVQSSWRKTLAQVAFEDKMTKRYLSVKTRAIIKIQAFQRCQKQRLNYFLKKRIAIMIQSLCRAVLAQRSFTRFKTAVSKIQVKYRDYQNKKRRYILVSRVVQVQSLARRAIVQTCTLKRHHEYQRQVELASNQVSSETKVASALIVDSLLTKRESMTIGPCLKTLAARVNSTLNEAKSLSSEEIRDFVHRDPLEISVPCLKRLADRVHSTLNEAESLSNEDIRDFVHRDPLVIPLPRVVKKPDSTTSLRVKCPHTETLVRSNKELLISDNSEAKNDHVNSKALPSKAKTSAPDSGQKLLKATKLTASSVITTRDSFMNRNNSDANFLAKQAADLMREARAAMQKKRLDKNRHDTSFVRNKNAVAMPDARRSSEIRAFVKRKTSKEDYHKDEPVGDKTGLQLFDDATMPSPIRPQEETPDWDWTSEW